MLEETPNITFLVIMLLLVAVVGALFVMALFGPVPSWLYFIKGLFGSYG
jgi:hypothetical protein